MVRIGLFCIFFPLAMVELLFYRHFGLILVGSLYMILAFQADHAAARFLRYGLDGKDSGKKRRAWNEEEPAEEKFEEELRVPPLPSGRRTSPGTPPPAEPAYWERAKGTASPTAPSSIPTRAPVSAPAQPERRRPRELPASPNFRGPAHEVLGVDENAATRTILRAFRHWIKRFHPDSAQTLPTELANARVQRLTDAKELLLDRRRRRRSA